MSDFLCPYCLEYINSREILFRCVNSGSNCPRVDDEPYSEYWGGGNRQMGQVFRPKYSLFGGRSSPTICPTCAKTTSTMVCPECHNELPLDAGDVDNYFISVIGTKGSGKSVFLATLINNLQQDLGHRLNGSFRAMNEATTNRYRREFYEPLYKKKIKLEATRSIRTVKKHPLIFRLNLSDGSIFEGSKKIVNLVFYDTAGEDFDSKLTIQQDLKYILNSDGIIFLVDPLQISSIRDLLPPNIDVSGSDTDPNDILDHLIDLIRKEQCIDNRDKIGIPIAISFSKIDVLRSLIGNNSVLFNRSTHGPSFNVDEFSQVNFEILSHLQNWIGSGLQNKIAHEFKLGAFFGFSALGSTPNKNGTLSESIHSLRIEDPFCWLLWIYDLISESKR